MWDNRFFLSPFIDQAVSGERLPLDFNLELHEVISGDVISQDRGPSLPPSRLELHQQPLRSLGLVYVIARAGGEKQIKYEIFS